MGDGERSAASSPCQTLVWSKTESLGVDCSATVKKETVLGGLLGKTLDSSTFGLSEDPALPHFSEAPWLSEDNSDAVLLPGWAPLQTPPPG